MELVVVMSIVGVMMAVAGPRVGNYVERDRVRTLNRRLTVDLSMARSEAIRLKTPVTITFDPTGNFYEITGMSDVRTPDGVQGTYRVDLVGKSGYEAKLDSADFGGTPVLTFDEFGRADANGTIVIKSGETQSTLTMDKGKSAVRTELKRGNSDVVVLTGG